MSYPEFDHNRVKRAMEYIRSGLVSDVEETGDGKWQAIVNGSDTYEVMLTLNGVEIIDSVCSCPDDLSKYCKHIIATFYMINNPKYSEMIDAPVGKSPGLKRTTKNDTIKQRVNEYITGLDPEEAIELLATLRSAVNGIDAYIVNNVMPPSGNVTNELRQRLKRSLASARRLGFFDYHASREWLDAVEGAFNLIDRVEKVDVLDALKLCVIVYDIAISHAGTIDDSNGEFSYAMEPSIEKFYDICGQITDPVLHNKALSLLLNIAKGFVGNGWYSTWSWLKDVTDIVLTIDEADIVLEAIEYCLDLDNRGSDKFLGEGLASSLFDISPAADIRYALAAKFLNEQGLSDFVAENYQFHGVRESYADLLIQKESYESARVLCEESIELDKELRGIVIDWVKRLQNIAKNTDNNTLYKRTARTLFESTGDLEQLAILKRLSSNDDWTREYDQLVENHKTLGTRHLLQKLYIFENKLELLIDTLERSGLEEIEHYHSILKDSLPHELAELYIREVKNNLQSTSGRGVYQQCARALRRAKKLGLGNEVSKIISELIKAYPSRRAMIEELRGV